jgi:hypothetical protein
VCVCVSVHLVHAFLVSFPSPATVHSSITLHSSLVFNLLNPRPADFPLLVFKFVQFFFSLLPAVFYTILINCHVFFVSFEKCVCAYRCWCKSRTSEIFVLGVRGFDTTKTMIIMMCVLCVCVCCVCVCVNDDDVIF